MHAFRKDACASTKHLLQLAKPQQGDQRAHSADQAGPPQHRPERTAASARNLAVVREKLDGDTISAQCVNEIVWPGLAEVKSVNAEIRRDPTELTARPGRFPSTVVPRRR